MAMIQLEAVPGRALPVPGRRAEFYGMRRVVGDPSAEVVLSVPGGHRYISTGPFEVEARGDAPRDAYLRRAVIHGDLRVVTPEAPTPMAAPSDTEE